MTLNTLSLVIIYCARLSQGDSGKFLSTRTNHTTFSSRRSPTLNRSNRRVYLLPENFFIGFVMAALCNTAGHYIFALWFLSFFFLLSFSLA